jgi:4-amino-4-deoxy-L-arabinose transferase-like glycosyltransferase
MKSSLREQIMKYRWLALILATFVTLATVYNVTTPLFEAPDEGDHYRYVKHLADGHGLPMLEAGGNWVGHESWQPPLYYILGALATFWIDTDNAGQLEWVNPHWDGGGGGMNVVYHTSAESFPYRRAALAMHIVRFLSTLMGAVTVAATGLIALELFPGQKWIAIGAAAISAFIPQFLFISGVINNDNLVIALSSLVLLVLLRLLKRNAQMRDFIILGLLLGLAFLAKVSALALLPLTLVVLALLAYHQRSWRVLLSYGTSTIAVAFIVSGWWYLRNWVLYDHPLAWQTMLEMSAPLLRTQQRSLMEALSYAQWLRKSFWAVFGYGILIDSFLYKILDFISCIGLVGWMILAIRQLKRRSLDRSTALGLSIILLWAIIVFASLVRWMQILEVSNQGRLLFPAVSSISILLFVGLAQIAPTRHTWLPAGVVGVGLFLLAAICPFRFIIPAYAHPPASGSMVMDSIGNPVHINFDGKIELVGYELSPRALKPGESVSLAFYWKALAKMDRSYTLFIHLLGRDGQVMGRLDTIPYGGRYSTLLWEPGEVFRDEYEVTISQEAAPSRGTVIVGFYPWGEPGSRLLAYSAEGQPVGDHFGLVPIKIAPAKPRYYTPQYSLRVDFAGRIALMGYDLPRETIEAGETLHLTLYLQGQAEMDEDYTVFTHLLNEENQIVAQRDSQPQNGNYPTSIWDIEEVVKDEYEMVLDPDTPSGRYRLGVGLYLLATGERLPAFVGGKRSPEDRVLLREVQVENER